MRGDAMAEDTQRELQQRSPRNARARSTAVPEAAPAAK
jgi:hypothetical protein